ncbi:MAG: apolipoprotein N-acyltransferase [Rikenellaceae bacterium]
MGRKLLAVLFSVVLLSLGWLSVSGLSLLVALVPLLWISSRAEDSSRGWWQTFGYALLTFVAWNVATVWWIWFATPAGPIAATIVSSTYSMIAFMSFHTLSKKASKPLSYTLLISLWIALEYFYMQSSASWPWLFLGNGFSSDIWAIQWYEYTGLFGGSLWVLASNILIFEAIESRSKARGIVAAAVALVPLIVSGVIYLGYEEPTEGSIEVSVVQPNIHFGREDRPSTSFQRNNLLELVASAPTNSDFVVMPECAIPDFVYLPNIERTSYVRQLKMAMQNRLESDAALISGVSSIQYYHEGEQSATARHRDGKYYDIYNSAIFLPPHHAPANIHHKAKLVVGTESIPFASFFKSFEGLIIDLGGSLGQLAKGTERVVFESKKASVGTAICYEALYGAYFGEFVRNGAEAMFVISNDCWWDNTPGYRHLFSMSAIRAVEHRRSIARSANTGISGFISSRGDHLETLGWDERGVLTDSVALNSRITIYTRYGDYIARIAIFVAILSWLNFFVLCIRRRNHLV